MFRMLSIPALVLTLVSCSLLPDPRPADRLTLAAWNVENLFDEVRDGGDTPNSTRRKAGPGPSSGAGAKPCQGDPQPRPPRHSGDGEVEGAHALDVLNTRFLGDQGYTHTFLAPPEVPGIKTVIVSRFPAVRTGLLFPGSDGAAEPLRPVVEAEFDLGGRSLVVLANHWKSRIPTPSATEKWRREAARAVSARIRELETRPDRPFIAAVGDFNTSLELSRGLADRALVPGGAADETTDGLVVFAGREAAGRSLLPGAVWDPWETVSDPPGSYFYQGDWDRLDHAFVAVSSLKLADWTFRSFLVAAYASQPLPYGPRTPTGCRTIFPSSSFWSAGLLEFLSRFLYKKGMTYQSADEYLADLEKRAALPQGFRTATVT